MLDFQITVAGLVVGFVVGLTGMGGGALMTPILVLLFKVDPLTAVSSDIVASMIMKPIGGAVHWRRGTVNRPLVACLAAGSIPAAFLGVLILSRIDSGAALQSHIKLSLGIALLVVTLGIVIKPLLAGNAARAEGPQPFVVRPFATVIIGIVGGLVVGLTSVGSGSLMMILLLLLYPRLKLSELVGTDLVQAVPLVTSAALGHLIFGDFKLSLSASILLGSVPGIFFGARFSSRAPDYVIRPALIVVLFSTGLKLIGAPNLALAVVAPLSVLAGAAYAITSHRAAQRASTLAPGWAVGPTMAAAAPDAAAARLV
ncbi:MAG TPA: sulfite exporter TauE/SafE family protein [Polyangia bacterium]